jgi:hypothetical protein
MKRAIKRDEDRERAEEAYLLRNWHGWHRAERKAVLAGPHGPMFERLLFLLKSLELKSATILLAFVRGVDWSTVSGETRLIVLHEINDSITRLRIKHGLAPFDDGWPGERNSAFITIRQHLFPTQVAPPGAQPGLSNQ